MISATLGDDDGDIANDNDDDDHDDDADDDLDVYVLSWPPTVSSYFIRCATEGRRCLPRDTTAHRVIPCAALSLLI